MHQRPAGGAVHREKVLLAERIITQVITSSDPGTPVSLFELTYDYATDSAFSRTEY